MNEILDQLIAVLEAMEGRPTVANQGQALDGYSALENFKAIAEKARQLRKDLNKETP